jgi:hypothetical protein
MVGGDGVVFMLVLVGDGSRSPLFCVLAAQQADDDKIN